MFILSTLTVNPVKALSGYPYSNSGYCRRDSVEGEIYGCVEDDWGFYTRECTSYAAWAVNQQIGNFHNYMTGPNTLSALMGHAETWNDSASSIGYSVGSIPIQGAIVVFEANVSGAGGVGHVAYVESVNTDGTFNLSEYNWNASSANNWMGDHNYNTRDNRSVGTGISFITFASTTLCGTSDVVISNQTITGPLNCAASNKITISPETNVNISGGDSRFYIQ